MPVTTAVQTLENGSLNDSKYIAGEAFTIASLEVTRRRNYDVVNSGLLVGLMQYAVGAGKVRTVAVLKAPGMA